MNQEIPSNGKTPPQAAASGSGIDRRSLLRAGAGAAGPVLMTLSTNSVAANTVGCVVASSFVSVAEFKSRNASATIQCSNLDLNYWRNIALGPEAGWPSGINLNATVAALLGTTTSPYNDSTLVAVLGAPVETNSQLGVLQHLAALALSLSVSGAVPNPGGVNVTYLQSVWSNYVPDGVYDLPASGINWDSAQLVAWLQYLMGAPLPA